MARYVAKNIVAAGLAKRCEVALAFVIGGIEPEAVTINTFGTGKISDAAISALVENVFSLKVADIGFSVRAEKASVFKDSRLWPFWPGKSGL